MPDVPGLEPRLRPRAARPAVTWSDRLRSFLPYMACWLVVLAVAVVTVLVLPDTCPDGGRFCDGITYQGLAFLIGLFFVAKVLPLGIPIGWGVTLLVLQLRRKGGFVTGAVGVAAVLVPSVWYIARLLGW